MPVETVVFTQLAPPLPGGWQFEFSLDGVTWQPVAITEPTESSVCTSSDPCWQTGVDVPASGYLRAKAFSDGLESGWSNVIGVPEPGFAVGLMLGVLGVLLAGLGRRR